MVQTLLTLFYGPNHKISLQPLSSLEESLDNYVINLSNSSSSDDINYELYDAGEVAFSSHLINTLPSSIKTQNEYPIEFLMSWNRRISESYKFFQMMHAAGFICYHHGSCIYSFVPTLGS